MGNHKYSAEFEIRASTKMLFPYVTSPAGLAQWFADQVSIGNDKVYNFVWDGQSHYARLTAQRLNRYARFEFLPEDGENVGELSYLEFRLDTNELTQSSFLKVTDYSGTDNEDDLRELWTNLVSNLREVVRG